MDHIQPSSAEAGFTLLEMGLVLFILLVIAGAAIPVTSGLIAQERLKSQARELQDYATSARKLAVTEGRPYEIILDPAGFSLEPFSSDPKQKAAVVSRVKLASSIRYSIRRWGEKDFGNASGKSWVFQPDGICEPIRVHFENRDGWIEDTFNPLTARPQDESYRFP